MPSMALLHSGHPPFPIEATAMNPPLTGIRVLELNRVAPGAFCTMMLGDMVQKEIGRAHV